MKISLFSHTMFTYLFVVLYINLLNSFFQQRFKWKIIRDLFILLYLFLSQYIKRLLLRLKHIYHLILFLYFLLFCLKMTFFRLSTFYAFYWLFIDRYNRTFTFLSHSILENTYSLKLRSRIRISRIHEIYYENIIIEMRQSYTSVIYNL